MTDRELARFRADIEQETAFLDDGYLYWWPSEGRRAFSASTLRLIADFLDDWNNDWDAQVQRDVGKGEE